MNIFNKILLSLFLLFAATTVFSSNVKTLKMKGEVFLETSDSKDATIYVYLGNELVDTVFSTKSGRFDVELELGYKYVLELQKDGYVSKKLAVNTEVKDPFKRIPTFSFLCELIQVENEIVSLEYDFPATIIKMNEKKGKFEYSSSYTKTISKMHADLKEKVTQKFEF